jgi:hypothetical protein
LLIGHRGIFPLSWRNRSIDSGVTALSKGPLGFSIPLLFAAMLFLGAGLSSRVTAADTPETGQVLVSFVITGHHDSVCLSADFNGWSSESLSAAKKTSGRSNSSSPGIYRYFVIDKRDWICDPGALIQEEDGFGKKNSVLLIEPGVTKMLIPP